MWVYHLSFQWVFYMAPCRAKTKLTRNKPHVKNMYPAAGLVTLTTHECSFVYLKTIYQTWFPRGVMQVVWCTSGIAKARFSRRTQLQWWKLKVTWPQLLCRKLAMASKQIWLKHWERAIPKHTKPLPSGKHTENCRKSPFWIGKSTINVVFSIAMLNYQRVSAIFWLLSWTNKA